MAPLRFLTEFDPRYGESVELSPGLARVVANNPSKYTAWGTGTHLLGVERLMVVDPGPDDADHVDALVRAIDGRPVTHLLVTHTHADHSPAVRALQERTGATAVGIGPHPPGADDRAEEHGDTDFVPDQQVADGDVINNGETRVQVLHTPGHISNHACYADLERGVLFPGDHVMGWSTTVISPPAGDVTDYLAQLRRLLERDEHTYHPTHGPPITDPHPYVAALIDHRLDRERQILDQLSGGPRTIQELVAVLYADVAPELHEPAGRSVHAHLLALMGAGRAVALDGARFARTD